MDEYRAKNEGLVFIGICSENFINISLKVFKEREKYPKARVAIVECCSGYCAYADNVYVAYKTIESYNLLKEESDKDIMKPLKDKAIELIDNSKDNTLKLNVYEEE